MANCRELGLHWMRKRWKLTPMNLMRDTNERNKKRDNVLG